MAVRVSLILQKHDGDYDCAADGCLRDADFSIWTSVNGNLSPLRGPYCAPCWVERWGA